MSIEIKQHLSFAAAGDDAPAAAGHQAAAAVPHGACRHGPGRDAREPDPRGRRRVGQRAGQGQPTAPCEVDAAGGDVERVGETETPVVEIREDKIGTTAEVKADTTLERGGQRLRLGGLPGQPGGRGADAVVQVEQRGPAVARVDADPRHLAVRPPRVAAQAVATSPREEDGIAMLIIGNLTPDGYLEEPLEELAEEAEVSVELAESVLKRVQEFDPVGVGARSLEECLLIQARHVGADDDVVVGIIARAPANLEKKNYQAIAKDLEPAGRGDLRGGQGRQELRPQAGAAVHVRGADVHHARRLHPQGRRQVLRGRQRRRPAQAEDLRLLPDGAGGRRRRRASTSRRSCAARSGSSGRSSSASAPSSGSPSRS